MALFGSATTTKPATDLNANNDRDLLNPPEDSVSDLSFSPQADFLTVASWDKKVRIYEINGNGDSQGRAMYEHQHPVLSAQWYPDGTKVVSGGCDNTVRAYDLQSSQGVQIGSHDSAVSSVRVVDVGMNAPVVASVSWDKTLKYWDGRQQNAVATVQMPERVYSMDSRQKLLVAATAGRDICIIDLSNPGTIFKKVQSPLKWQTRCVSCYFDGSGYAVGSIEGRCAIQYVDPVQQNQKGFSFKCHRETKSPTETLVYPVNSIAFHPTFGTFATAGSDGTIHLWDKDQRHRLCRYSQVGGSVPTCTFNRTGTIFAYAISYDWSRGHQFNQQSMPNVVKLHAVNEAEVKPRDDKKK
jgi:mRNA export factor